ncbi:hypothetical protein KXW38_002126, partial [Aspergillus fumigatus]
GDRRHRSGLAVQPRSLLPGFGRMARRRPRGEPREVVVAAGGAQRLHLRDHRRGARPRRHARRHPRLRDARLRTHPGDDALDEPLRQDHHGGPLRVAHRPGGHQHRRRRRPPARHRPPAALRLLRRIVDHRLPPRRRRPPLLRPHRRGSRRGDP